MDLDELRQRIDRIDDQLLDLLKERAELVPLIAAIKRDKGMSSVDPERERRLLDRLLTRGAGRFPKDAIQAVFREVISASVSLQSPVKVAFLGPEGTYSHLAARTLFGYAPRYFEEATISGVVDAVRRQTATYGVVPLENSTEGAVTSALDALLEGGCQIRREIIIPIEHCLMGTVQNLHDIERVYSHPQALAQCRHWLSESLPQAQLVQTDSTSLAVRKALADETGAAVGSPLASEIHSLPVVREAIQDHHENATRFVMIGMHDARPTGDDRTTVAFKIADDETRGSLRNTLQIFEDNCVNLSRIESRPRRGTPWRYLFIVDLDGHRLDAPVGRALTQLHERASSVQVLGSYPKASR